MILCRTKLPIYLCALQVIFIWLVEAYIFDMVAKNEVPTRDPVDEISTELKQVCFSKCHYMPKSCQSMIIESVGERNFICKFYDFTFDFHPELQGYTGISSSTLYYSKKYFKKDCHAWFLSGAREDGPYDILIAGKYPETVICKMVDDGSKMEGGWIMALNKTRTHTHGESNDFELYWEDYKNGFEVNSGLYLGNEYLHLLTEYEHQQLWAIYDHERREEFYPKVIVKAEADNYTILLDGATSRHESFGGMVHGNPFSARLGPNVNEHNPTCPLRKLGYWYLPIQPPTTNIQPCRDYYRLFDPSTKGNNRFKVKYAYILLRPKL
ncbi:angiopoietin-1-like [Clytia hemisphaerica]|uniref:Fibrinogen C-terminal domain-containing protein n=1 Tax=Clytia hemisphaerica TaxID=252671 RepID=A0A7M5XIW2_9CNID